jgi:hypothetical protein
MPKEINHENDSYKIYSSVECGKDRLSGATPHSREVIKKHEFKIVSFLFSVYDFLCSLFIMLLTCCDTLLMQSLFCSFIFRIKKIILKTKSVRGCPTLPYNFFQLIERTFSLTEEC